MRNVIGDEAIDAAVDAIIASSPRGVQVGLVIGRLGSGGRDVVLGLVPTPVKEDGSNAAVLAQALVSKSRSGGASLSIDADWIAEHARQVSRMLLGGMMVAGFYCLAPDNVLKQSNSTLCQVAKAIVASSSVANGFSDRLVLQITTSPRRLLCRICSAEANGVLSLKPIEWKLAKVISNLQIYSCSYAYEMSIPVFSTAGDVTFKKVLASYIESESEILQSAKALVDDAMLIDVEGSLSSNKGPHDVKLLLPLVGSKDFEGFRPVLGIIKVKGTVQARAYGFPRESIAHAVRSIKEDIMDSLRSRLDLICEEAEQENSGNTLPLSTCCETATEFDCILPKRVLLPWNGLLVCDYLMPTESLKDVENRCKDLLAEALETESVLQPEEFPLPGSVAYDDDLKQPVVQKQAIGSAYWLLGGALLTALIAIILAILAKSWF